MTDGHAAPRQRKHLVLHIEIPGFYADDLDRCAGYLSEPGPPRPEDRLYVVTEEWMREEVGVTLVSLPGEKCMSDDFEVHAYTGRIVGAETRDAALAGEENPPVADDKVTAYLAHVETRCARAAGDPDAAARIGSAHNLASADVPRLLAAVRAGLDRHKRSDEPVVTHALCARHSFIRSTAQEWRDAVAACIGCESTSKFVCVTCRHECPDDGGWPCAEYRAIAAALLGETSG